MEIVVKGRHTAVPERFRMHVQSKLAKLERYDGKVIRVDVELSREHNPRMAGVRERVELTLYSRGPVIRAEAAAADPYAALDGATSKLAARLRRAAERRADHQHGNHGHGHGRAFVGAPSDARADDLLAGPEGNGRATPSDEAGPSPTTTGLPDQPHTGVPTPAEVAAALGRRGIAQRPAAAAGGDASSRGVSSSRGALSSRGAQSSKGASSSHGASSSNGTGSLNGLSTGAAASDESAGENFDADRYDLPDRSPMVVRTKTHRAAAMTLDDALSNMELVGHDFYLFQDLHTGRASVVYRRRGYDYGVIHLIGPDDPAVASDEEREPVTTGS